MVSSVRVAELLSAKICHDLVNPLGACNNGLEMLDDANSEIFDQARQLAIDSGRSAARVLQYFRLAYGTAAERSGDGLDVKGQVEEFFKEGAVEVTWTDESYNDPISAPEVKLLLNLLLVADECLPRGGSLSVQILSTGGGGHELAILAMGEGARLREESLEALTKDLHERDLTTRNIQGVFTRLLAGAIPADLQVDATQENCVIFSVAS